MEYNQLKKLQQYLIQKEDKTLEQKKLLDELNCLFPITESLSCYSLAMTPSKCPSCGRDL